MIQRAVVIVALLASCGSPPPSAPTAAPREVVREVALRGGTIKLVVEHDGDEAWANYVADRASAYLPVAEQYLDVPFRDAAAGMFRGMPEPWTVRIVGRKTVMLGDVHIGAYNNSSGVFGPDRAIVMEYRLAPIGDPALVMHELTHYWFRGAKAVLAAGATRDDSAPSWFFEGLASMMPIAIAESGALPVHAAEQRAMRRHWGQWAVPPSSADIAIAHDPRRDGKIGIFYGKSYRVQLIFEHELGAERYRALLQHAARRRLATNDDVLAFLHDEAGAIDWPALLRGWIFDGAYGPYSPADIPRFLP